MRNSSISSVDCLTFSTTGYLLIIIKHAFRGEIAYLQMIDMSGIAKRRKKITYPSHYDFSLPKVPSPMPKGPPSQRKERDHAPVIPSAQKNILLQNYLAQARLLLVSQGKKVYID